MINGNVIFYQEFSMLPVNSEINYFKEPFQRRAREICRRENLPDWKTYGIAHNLESNFLRFVTDGLSLDDALSGLKC